MLRQRQGVPVRGPLAALVALLALAPSAAAEPTQLWRFEGDAVFWSDSYAGPLCPGQLFGQPGRVHLALLDSPGGGFDFLAFAFQDLVPATLPPCALSRAGCFGEGDAVRGWRGVCAEGLPYVTWWLRPMVGGGYDFSSVAPLGVGGWLVRGAVAAAAPVPLPA